MKNVKSLAFVLSAAITLTLSACGSSKQDTGSDILSISKQGYFTSGGTVTEAVEGEYDPTSNWMDSTRAGNTAHVDHANVF